MEVHIIRSMFLRGWLILSQALLWQTSLGYFLTILEDISSVEVYGDDALCECYWLNINGLVWNKHCGDLSDSVPPSPPLIILGTATDSKIAAAISIDDTTNELGVFQLGDGDFSQSQWGTA